MIVCSQRFWRRAFVWFVLCSMVAWPEFSGAHHPDHKRPEYAFGPIFPSLSRDGESVVFSFQGAIWTLVRNNGEMTQRTSAPGFDIYPAWSPKGDRIAYVRGSERFSGTLRVYDVATGSDEAVPAEGTVYGKLAFDPDGTRILAKLGQSGQPVTLGWIDIETGQFEKVIPAPRYLQPSALSPDGNWIAGITIPDFPGEQMGNNGPFTELWRISSDGQRKETLLEFPARIYDICWTEDQKAMYVVTDIGGVYHNIWHLPLENSLASARQITFGEADEYSPSLSDNGRSLLYTDNRYGLTSLMAFDPEEDRHQVIPIQTRNFHRATGKIRLSLQDKSESGPLSARVSILQEKGKYYAPSDSLYRLFRGEMHFYLSQPQEWELPEGTYSIRVSRGPEYKTLRKQVRVLAGETHEVSLPLDRWTFQRTRGWWSGESHIHANYGYGHWYNSPTTMWNQCSGEDLVVCNFMVANSASDGVFDRQYFRGRPDPLSTDTTILYWNEEFRSTLWGHMTLLNLKQLVEPVFTGFLNTTHPHDFPTNVDVARHTHDQHGHVNYTHPASNVKDPYLSAYSAKALPVDVALGTVDSVDVMGTGHEANVPLWYRLLNCGFRVPASAGTDCFLNRIPSRLPGQDRVYVQVAEPFSYSGWIDGLKAGKTFVTNAPMMEFAVNGQTAGSEIALSTTDQDTVHVTGVVQCLHPLDQAEVIYRGEVIHRQPVSLDSRRIEIDVHLSIPETGWLALRVSGPAHPDVASNTPFAHSSPVYVVRQDALARSSADAQYFLEWIDRLEGDLHKRDRVPSRHRDHVDAQIEKARTIYRDIRDRP